jgi:hypothetical protein
MAAEAGAGGESIGDHNNSANIDRSFKACHVFVPKAAVADPEPLWAEADLLAKDCGLRPWQSWRGDEWVFGFTDHLTAFFFTNYRSQTASLSE